MTWVTNILRSLSTPVPAKTEQELPEQLGVELCPFCGGVPVGGHPIGTADDSRWALVCKLCGATGPLRTTKAACIEAWNIRTVKHTADSAEVTAYLEVASKWRLSFPEHIGVIVEHLLECSACAYTLTSTNWKEVVDAASSHSLTFGALHVLRSRTPALQVNAAGGFVMMGFVDATFRQVPRPDSANMTSPLATITAERSANIK
jgi:Lar family restriction alleviation protein